MTSAGEPERRGTMSSLTYMTKRGAGVGIYGKAADLGKRMMRLRTEATLRSDHGAIIGEVTECDGSCDSRDHKWHWWYDPTGDGVTAEQGGMSNVDQAERNW
jgi:hypothetical protein